MRAGFADTASLRWPYSLDHLWSSIMKSMAGIFLVMTGFFAVAYIIRTVVQGIIRYAEVRRGPEVTAASLQDRLERIEVSIDAIAIEVERLGEHHRFNAQLALNRPDPLPTRVVTPH
jgi:hypothetical protein